MFRDSFLHRWAKRLLPESLRPQNVLARQIDCRVGRTVYAGPFRGMKYCDASVGSVFYPKILGAYEKELHDVIEQLISSKPDCVVDIGAAEGYYAVGLARRLPSAKIIAFETTKEGRDLLAEMARINGVTNRIDLRGQCEVEDLRNALEGTARTVVICDVEGYEQVLLDPEKVPALRTATILVELHEFVVRGISSVIETRFSPTHHVSIILEQPRTRADYPFNNWYTRMLPTAYATYRVQEFRPERMSWMLLRPKT